MASQQENIAGQLTRQVLEQVVSRTSEGIVIADARTDGLPVVYANPAYETLSGYTLDELTGNACPLLQTHVAASSAIAPPEVDRLQQAIGRAESCEVVVPVPCKDGSSRLSEVNLEPLFDDDGEVQYLLFRQRPAATGHDLHRDRANAEQTIGSAYGSKPDSDSDSDADSEAEAEAEAEIGIGTISAGDGDGESSGATVCSEMQQLQSALGQARKRIDSLSRTDTRTGLLRFEFFTELVQRDLDIARRECTGIALMLFEVMEFDAYRATFGGSAADSCLRMVAAQLNGTLRRASDLATRCTDTSFVAFVRARDHEEARALAHRIQRNVRGLGLHNPRATVSRYVGVALGVVHTVPGPDDDLDSLLARAREDIQQRTMSVPAQVSGASR